MKPDSPFELILGNRDVVESLEHALEQAREGKLVGVVICGVTEGGIGHHWAHRDDIAYPWPRLLAAVTDAQQQIAREGLV